MQGRTATGSHLRVRPSLILEPAQLQEAVEYLSDYDEFVIDVETTRRPSHINDVLWVGLGGPGRVFLIPCGHPKGHLIHAAHYEMLLPSEEKRRVLLDGTLSQARKKTLVAPTFQAPPKQMYPKQVFDLIRPLLFSERMKIGHNLKFDLISVSKYYGEEIPGPYDDTIIITHCLDENRLQYDLKNLIMDWLYVPKVERKDFYPNIGKMGVENFSLDDVAQYLAKDVRYTWLYRRNQYPRLAKNGLSEGYELEMDLYPVLMRMECTGFPVDTTRLDIVGKELKNEIDALAGAVWALAGRQFDLTNVDIKRDLLFKPKAEGGQGLKPLNYTPKTHRPQLNKATLEHYAETNTMADLMREWSELAKLHGTFITGLTGHMINGRIHTNFNQHGTVTTRLSAHEPNLQQIPARGRGTVIRELFVPSPGKILVVADYDQIELRCAAFLSQDAEMLRVFMEGQDIHRAAAAAMYQVRLEDVTPEQRQVGKTMNFLTLYGGGAAKLARVAGVLVYIAQQFIDRYYQQFKGLNQWKKVLLREAKHRGEPTDPQRRPPYVLIPPFDRRRRLPDLFSMHEYDRYRAERQAVNSAVQGFASNIMKLALIDLAPVLRPLDADMLCTVHDEIIVQCDSDVVDTVKGIVSMTMSSVQCRGKPILGTVPLQAKASSGPSWAKAKE